MISIRKILCPVDFSESSDHALDYAVAFAQAHDAELDLLHVVQPVVYGVGTEGLGGDLILQVEKELGESATAQLRERTERLRKTYARISEHVATGAPFVEIIRHAKEQQVDLIVMGTHGRTGLAHALIGSCAERVVRKAPCPVLTVKHPGHDFVMP